MSRYSNQFELAQSINQALKSSSGFPVENTRNDSYWQEGAEHAVQRPTYQGMKLEAYGSLENNDVTLKYRPPHGPERATECFVIGGAAPQRPQFGVKLTGNDKTFGKFLSGLEFQPH
jgi:hypothetical protein